MRIAIILSCLLFCVTLLFVTLNANAGQYEYTSDSLKKRADEKRERVGKTYWFAASETAPKPSFHPFISSLDKIKFSDKPTHPKVNTFKVTENESFEVLKILPDKKSYGIDGFYKIKFESGKVAYITIRDFDKSFRATYGMDETEDTIHSEPPPERMEEKQSQNQKMSDPQDLEQNLQDQYRRLMNIDNH